MTTAAELIKNVSDSQDEILVNLLELYVPTKRFDWDPTFGHGGFYRSGIVPLPGLPSDLVRNRLKGTEIHSHHRDCRAPFPSHLNAPASIIFDPPFLHACGKKSVMGKQFGSYNSQDALRQMYADSLSNFFNVLQPGGVLVFKCCDVIESSKKILTHCYVWSMACFRGFEVLDLFVLTTNKCIVGWNHHKQQHARNMCSYFMVFRKPYEKGTRA